MRTWTCLAGLLALLLGLIPCPVSAAPSAYHLSKVVMLTRHGVAAPADDNQLPRITGKAWPQWPVGPGQLSPRGAGLLTAQWASLRALYLEAGLLPAQKTESRVFVRADNTPRSRGSAEALLRGLTPGTLPSYAVVNLDPDPLFEPVQAGLAIFDPAETALAVLDHINGDFSQFWESLGEPMSLLDQLTGPLSSEACNSINLPGGCRLSDMVPSISIMDIGRRVEIRGGLGLGSTLVDLLVQEYAQWPQQDAAWGQANAAASIWPPMKRATATACTGAGRPCARGNGAVWGSRPSLPVSSLPGPPWSGSSMATVWTPWRPCPWLPAAWPWSSSCWPLPCAAVEAPAPAGQISPRLRSCQAIPRPAALGALSVSSCHRLLSVRRKHRPITTAFLPV